MNKYLKYTDKDNLPPLFIDFITTFYDSTVLESLESENQDRFYEYLEIINVFSYSIT